MSKGAFYPLEIIKGETLEFEFDVQLLGEQIDPADVTMVGRFARPETITPLSFTIAESEDNPYVWVVTYPADQSDVLTPATYTWEIKMTNNETTKVTTLFYGTLVVSATVISPVIPAVAGSGWVDA